MACAIVDRVMDLEYCRPSATSMTFSKHSAIERNAICRLDFHRPRVVYIVAGPKKVNSNAFAHSAWPGVAEREV